MGGLSKRQRSVEVNQHRHSVISRVSTTMGVKKTIWVEFPNKEENLSHLYQKHISGNCTNALIKTCAFSGSTPSSERTIGEIGKFSVAGRLQYFLEN